MSTEGAILFWRFYMKFIISSFKTFSKFELLLWLGSLILLISPYLLLKNTNYFMLFTSIIGSTALIFVAKGNVIGQILTVIFAILYGIISFSFRYYGEMITYLGMTAPIAIVAIVTWLRNSFNGVKFEVKVNTLTIKEYILMIILAIIVTCIFYFILKFFNTNNLLISTFSILTSFLASYLTMKRSA